MSATLFAYGSLCSPAVYFAVTGVRRRGEPARFDGHRALRLRGAVYPVLVAHHKHSVGGVLYRHLQAFELRRLDAFEGVLYRRGRVVVRLAARSVYAQVYRRARAVVAPHVEEDWQLAEFMTVHQWRFARYWRDRRRRVFASTMRVDSNAGRASRNSRSRNARARIGLDRRFE